MHDRVTASWRRLADEASDPGDSGIAHNAPTPLPSEKEAQLQTWEDEGGTTARAIGTDRVEAPSR